jgi:small subunit ribosomal protein S8
MTDPISDLIIRLKNARLAGKSTVRVPHSKLRTAVAEKLKQRGLIADIATRGKDIHKALELTLSRTESGAYRFQDVLRISKPGRRVYVGAKEIHKVRGGTGFSVLSTPRGVLFGDEARKENVGGEVLFEIW